METKTWDDAFTLTRSVLFVSANIKTSLGGKIIALIYKIPNVYLICDIDNDSIVVYRLIPNQAQAGFFLNPVVDNAEEIQALASGKLPQQPRFLSSCKLRSLASSLFFKNEIDLTVQELDLSRLASGSP